MLNHPIFHLSNRLMMAAAQTEKLSLRELKAFDISLANFKVLTALVLYKKISPPEIVELVGGTRANLSQRLAVLEERGLVTRACASPKQDRRTIVIRVTKKGQELHAQAWEQEQVCIQVLAKKFGKEQTKQLDCLLEAYIACVEEIVKRSDD